MPGNNVLEKRNMYRYIRLHCCFLILIIVCALAVSSCGQAGASTAGAVAPDIKQNAVSATPTPSAWPNRLLIPVIGVNASVEPVGILSNGDMDTPRQNPWTDVGWYSGGPRPGERGSAVIDGHLDRPGGSPAVFWSLRQLHVGDEVIVVTSSTKTLHFHVVRIAFYAPESAPLQGIFADSGGTYLNLITCAGDWIPSQHQTTLRMVVYTSA